MTLERVINGIRETAEDTEMPVDRDIYVAAGRDSREPILYAGNLRAAVAFFARDLGKDEVALGEPLIGGAGRRVRRSVHRFLYDAEPPTGDKNLSEALGHILVTNTVPYKPVGNKAYPPRVRERFRPHIAAFLACCWEGKHVITLGTEAFKWFTPYGEPGAFEDYWKSANRYVLEITCQIEAQCGEQFVRRPLTIAPLPHPSPLNRAYLELFPSLLQGRLAQSPLRACRR